MMESHIVAEADMEPLGKMGVSQYRKGKVSADQNINVKEAVTKKYVCIFCMGSTRKNCFISSSALVLLEEERTKESETYLQSISYLPCRGCFRLGC